MEIRNNPQSGDSSTATGDNARPAGHGRCSRLIRYILLVGGQLLLDILDLSVEFCDFNRWLFLLYGDYPIVLKHLEPVFEELPGISRTALGPGMKSDVRFR